MLTESLPGVRVWPSQTYNQDVLPKPLNPEVKIRSNSGLSTWPQWRGGGFCEADLIERSIFCTV